MRLKIPVHDKSLFTWTSGTGVAEMSDLQAPGDGQVWDDACDVGFVVRDDNGDELLFTFTREVKNQEGEVMAWVYTHPPCVALEVHILND